MCSHVCAHSYTQTCACSHVHHPHMYTCTHMHTSHTCTCPPTHHTRPPIHTHTPPSHPYSHITSHILLPSFISSMSFSPTFSLRHECSLFKQALQGMLGYMVQKCKVFGDEFPCVPVINPFLPVPTAPPPSPPSNHRSASVSIVLFVFYRFLCKWNCRVPPLFPSHR